MQTKMKIAVLGDGGWGTTLALLLHKNGHAVTLWGAFPDYIDRTAQKRENIKFLPGVKIPIDIGLTHDIRRAVSDKNIIVLAPPSQHMRSVLCRIPRDDVKKGAIYLSVAKGIENGTLRRMSEVIHEELGTVTIAALSGPTISYEIAHGLPAAAVVASRNAAAARLVQKAFSSERFRLYHSSDLIGVEMGGSLKNVIAIAAGICDGMGFGANAKASLLTRGIAEIARLGTALGARRETFAGLSGLGDLVTTCVSSHGRNRWFGEEIGKGKKPADILRSTEMAVEGVPTARSAYDLGRRHGVEMPITEQIYRIIFKNKSPRIALKELMLRPIKSES
ncbi:MAG: NAD(P)H-dependent glycerol-3-phosphate dehydrogenase [Candidatus Omnitrophota bacterium]